jgi:hypothetical protein
MMSQPSVNGDARINGIRSITLDNEWLRVSILPEIGGKIYDLISKPTGRNFLWHNPRVLPQPYPVEAAMVDFWCGGWDDIFPTCESCEFQGLQYPALGELHKVQFGVDDLCVDGADGVARLSAFTHISPVKAEKTITVRGPVVHVRSEITNLGPLPLDFIWGTHPAFQPSRQMILRLPAKTGIVAHSSGPNFGEKGQRYAWPNLNTTAGTVVDMSRVYGMDAKGFCGHYATDLAEGWYALEDPETGEGVVVKFPVDLCPYIWMWLGYGGWRGHWVLIIEPYTSYPVRLSHAVEVNTHRRIASQETFTVDVAVSLYHKPETFADALARLDIKYVL